MKLWLKPLESLAGILNILLVVAGSAIGSSNSRAPQAWWMTIRV
jgi:hypothetical protein